MGGLGMGNEEQRSADQRSQALSLIHCPGTHTIYHSLARSTITGSVPFRTESFVSRKDQPSLRCRGQVGVLLLPRPPGVTADMAV